MRLNLFSKSPFNSDEGKGRLNLLESRNRAGKYLNYALGEILLIVIGILIALQVTSWNTWRNERVKE